VGLIGGALPVAMLVWLAGGLLTPVPLNVQRLVLAVLVFALLLRDFGVVRFWLPETHRQVPQSVLGKPGLLPAIRFGAELGTGFRTYVPSTPPYMLALALLLLPVSWGAVAGAALGFAAGRAATPTVRMFSGNVRRWDERLQQRLRLVVVGCACMAALLVAALAVAH
jgi:hypothetical protein